MFIALCSYFVYGMNPEPVICSIIYSFLTSYTSNKIRFGKNESIRYEIITSDAEALRKDIIKKIMELSEKDEIHKKP